MVYKRIRGETSAGGGGGASSYITWLSTLRELFILKPFFYHFSFFCSEVFAYGNSQITFLFSQTG